MRVGLVCPYSLDVAGGVQRHVLDLASHLREQGHDARVLAPASPGTRVPEWVDAVTGGLGVPYNGSVARVTFGPMTALRVRSWVRAGGFDVLHLHQPLAPSTTLLALGAARGPVVATWHMATAPSRAIRAYGRLLAPLAGRIDAHVAVSEHARDTFADHCPDPGSGDAVVIPNGVDVGAYARAAPDPRWTGARDGRPPTLALVGRYDEPRKGAAVLLAALPALVAVHPGLRVLVAGHGDPRALREVAGPHDGHVEVLGEVSEEDKRSLMASADVVLAPQTGGESFGVVLVEAMAAGAPLVASDLSAFSRVLDGGDLGALFTAGDPDALAHGVLAALADPAAAAERARRAADAAWRYDWRPVASAVVDVYRGAVEQAPAPTLRARGRRRSAAGGPAR